MSGFSANYTATDYDLRSLNHERRMLAVYRQSSHTDAGALQPLANACWRTSCFEWALYRDAETVRRLWGEGARALVQGFARRRHGFDPSPDQLILALHLSIAARERDAFTELAFAAPNLRSGALRDARAFRGSRAHFHLAEGYALVARALAEHKQSPARAAVDSLAAAREENDAGWWERQYPDALEASWRMREHDAVCALLSAVAHRIADEKEAVHELHDEEVAASTAADFGQAVDEALVRLEQFVERDTNHHPKLYIWLPGIALCALAASARLPIEWLQERYEKKVVGYSRLPLELLRNPAKKA